MKKSCYLSALIVLSACAIIGLSGCGMSGKNETHMNNAKNYRKAPSWANDASIYEVNIRQYTPEGTFNAFSQSLARLQSMGVKILWLMPIYPVSETNRKGTLGSYYAISDFRAVNPEFGALADFKDLLYEAHRLNMKVILDMVPNHTGWDHPWINEHPEWYTRDSNGYIISPLDPWSGQPTGWTDVADLNYENAEMRQALISDYLFWVNEIGIDGFRMDMAHFVPLEFWHQVRTALDGTGKELFMLAESESAEHISEGLFHANYAWPHHHIMNDVAKGHKSAADLRNWLKENHHHTRLGNRMFFLSNHDENSWAGSEIERMGDAYKTFAVHSFTIGGYPLIYSGMEEPLVKRLEFFEKDAIPFNTFSNQSFYAQLIKLKKENPALHADALNSKWDFISDDSHILAYRITSGDNHVLTILNLSPDTRSLAVSEDLSAFKVAIVDGVEINEDNNVQLSPWGYVVMTKE